MSPQQQASPCVTTSVIVMLILLTLNLIFRGGTETPKSCHIRTLNYLFSIANTIIFHKHGLVYGATTPPSNNSCCVPWLILHSRGRSLEYRPAQRASDHCSTCTHADNTLISSLFSGIPVLRTWSAFKITWYAESANTRNGSKYARPFFSFRGCGLGTRPPVHISLLITKPCDTVYCCNLLLHAR